MKGPALLVIAKEPRPGHAKTRLTPPCSPEQAAALAGAALRDTLGAVARVPRTRAGRRVLVFEGDPSNWCPAGFEVFPQRGAGLAARLAAAFEDVGEPALLVGMDTPQLTPALLESALAALAAPGVDAVLGPATDGGYWSIGLRVPRVEVFSGVPMSETFTGTAQRAQLARLGLSVTELATLRDVDTIADARAVADLAPGSEFAAALAAIEFAFAGVGRRAA